MELHDLIDPELISDRTLPSGPGRDSFSTILQDGFLLPIVPPWGEI
jgi:hypothetical protein